MPDMPDAPEYATPAAVLAEMVIIAGGGGFTWDAPPALYCHLNPMGRCPNCTLFVRAEGTVGGLPKVVTATWQIETPLWVGE